MKGEKFIDKLSGRMIALIMSLVMIFTIIPVSINADTSENTETTETTETTESTEETKTYSGSEFWIKPLFNGEVVSDVEIEVSSIKEENSNGSYAISHNEYNISSDAKNGIKIVLKDTVENTVQITCCITKGDYVQKGTPKTFTFEHYTTSQDYQLSKKVKVCFKDKNNGGQIFTKKEAKAVIYQNKTVLTDLYEETDSENYCFELESLSGITATIEVPGRFSYTEKNPRSIKIDLEKEISEIEIGSYVINKSYVITKIGGESVVAFSDSENLELGEKYGFSIADTSIATIDKDTGLVTGLKTGETTVTMFLNTTKKRYVTKKLYVYEDVTYKGEEKTEANPVVNILTCQEQDVSFPNLEGTTSWMKVSYSATFIEGNKDEFSLSGKTIKKKDYRNSCDTAFIKLTATIKLKDDETEVLQTLDYYISYCKYQKSDKNFRFEKSEIAIAIDESVTDAIAIRDEDNTTEKIWYELENSWDSQFVTLNEKTGKITGKSYTYGNQITVWAYRWYNKCYYEKAMYKVLVNKKTQSELTLTNVATEETVNTDTPLSYSTTDVDSDNCIQIKASSVGKEHPTEQKIVYSYERKKNGMDESLGINIDKNSGIELNSSDGTISKVNCYGTYVITARSLEDNTYKEQSIQYTITFEQAEYPYDVGFESESIKAYCGSEDVTIKGFSYYKNSDGEIEKKNDDGVYVFDVVSADPENEYLGYIDENETTQNSICYKINRDGKVGQIVFTLRRKADCIYKEKSSLNGDLKNVNKKCTLSISQIDIDKENYDVDGIEGENDWYTDSDVQIKGKVNTDEKYDYYVSESPDYTTIDQYNNCLTIDQVGESTKTFWVFRYDKEKNEYACGQASVTVKIDKTNPTASITMQTSWDKEATVINELPTKSTIKYTQKESSFTFTAEDAFNESGLDMTSGKTVQYFISSDVDNMLTEDALKAVQNWTDYSVKTSQLLGDFNFDKGVIYFKVTDISGRTTYTSTNGLVCDSTAPSVEISLPETDKTVYDGNVKVSLKLSDDNSGIDKVKYTIAGDEYTLDYKSGNTATFTIPAKDYNRNNIKVTVSATDKSHNSSSASTELNIDTTAPKIEVSYDNNSVVNSKYFTSARKATIKVTERNFNEADVTSKITNEDGNAPKLSAWTKHAGTGNGDNTYYTATVSYKTDGKYSFGISYTDLAGNKADATDFGESAAPTNFVVDTIDPVMQVSYNNNVANNGTYYQDSRTATITITEHNFSADNVNVNLNGEGASLSGWTTDGDEHTATVTFPGDGEYSWTASCTDEAGRKSNVIDEAEFVIDSVDPEVVVTDANGNAVKTNTAYVDDKITFVVGATDEYFEELEVNVSGVAYDSEAGFVSQTVGQSVVSQNATSKSVAIDNVENDGIYTLSYKATDKAGRTKSDEIAFSVNRHGSVFMLGDYAKTIQDTYVQDVTDSIEIIEINANTVEEHEVTVDDRVLTEGSEYEVTKANDTGWNKYTYSVDPSVFEEEGTHSVRTSSTDSNETSRYSDIDGVEYSFVVDKTAPTMTYGKVNENETYKGTSKDASVMVKDDGGLLSSFKVELQSKDGEVLDTLYQGAGEDLLETLDSKNNVINVSIPEGTALKLVATATDAAGNEAVKEVAGLTVTTSNMRIWFANKRVFYASVGGLGLLVAIVVISAVAVTGKKRKRTNEN